jgi:hypothetical protein
MLRTYPSLLDNVLQFWGNELIVNVNVQERTIWQNGIIHLLIGPGATSTTPLYRKTTKALEQYHGVATAGQLAST